MNIIRNVSMAVLCTVILFSCEVDYDFTGEELTRRVVINALITPQETFRIKLHWSGTYYEGDNFKPVTDAEIRLYEDNREVVRCRASDNGITQTPFFARTGCTYRLEISVDGYGELSAETTIPNAPAATVSFVQQKGWSRHFDLGKLEVANDFKALWIRGTYYPHSYKPDEYVIFCTTSPFVDQVNGANNAYESEDKGGTVDFEEFLRIPFEYRTYAIPLRFSVGGSSEDRHVFRIITASVAYDRYMRSRYKQQLNTEWGAEDNPFVEQITVYSNIINGIGIFAGYNYYQTPKL